MRTREALLRELDGTAPSAW